MNKKFVSLLTALLMAVLFTGTAIAAPEVQNHISLFKDGSVNIIGNDTVHGPIRIDLTEVTEDTPAPEVSFARSGRAQAVSTDRFGNPLPSEFYFYRELLTDDGKSAYDEILTAVSQGQQSIQLQTTVYQNQLEDLLSCVLYDHPEIIWLNPSWSYTRNWQNIVTSIRPHYYDIVNDADNALTRFEKEAGAVVSFAAGFQSNPDRVKAVHDWLVQYTDYDLRSTYNQSAYSTFIDHRTVCAGYSAAFQYCMQKLGIRTAYIGGVSAGTPHAWNLLELDGEYYAMDVTFDDPVGNPSGRFYYDYFNVTDDRLQHNHTREALSAKLPVANGTHYSFEDYYGSQYGTDFSSYSADGSQNQTPDPAPNPIPNEDEPVTVSTLVQMAYDYRNGNGVSLADIVNAARRLREGA